MRITAYWYGKDGKVECDWKQIDKNNFKDAARCAMEFAKEKVGLADGYMKQFRVLIDIENIKIISLKLVEMLKDGMPETAVVVRINAQEVVTTMRDQLCKIVDTLIPDLPQKIRPQFVEFANNPEVDDKDIDKVVEAIMQLPSLDSCCNHFV